MIWHWSTITNHPPRSLQTVKKSSEKYNSYNKQTRVNVRKTISVHKSSFKPLCIKDQPQVLPCSRQECPRLKTYMTCVLTDFKKLLYLLLIFFAYFLRGGNQILQKTKSTNGSHYKRRPLCNQERVPK